MRHAPLWFAGFSLLTLFAAVDCSSDFKTGTNETCTNNKLDENKGETAIDCGGPYCEPCVEGKDCKETTDCAAGLECSNLTLKCIAAHCTNKTTDGDETDKDCGGASCSKCDAGATCKQNNDCESTVCKSGKCTGASCSDKILNQEESDVDCGDPNGLCAPCSGGRKCTVAESCASKICNNGTCTEPKCDDRVKNGSEGDVDCGGSCTTLCGQGDTCLTDADCKSNVCNETCKDSQCGDTVKNGDETDVDCGASCGGCLEGKVCKVGSDCKSTFCKDGLCVIPTCSDKIQNQGESDVDCGSPITTCAPCTGGKVCSAVTDCESGICIDNRCVNSSCSDQVQNGSEGDVDCGGSCTTRCADGRKCNEMTDCVSGVCSDGTCAAAACNDLTQNGTETDADCGGTCSAKCEVGQGCKDKVDCKINSCNLGKCADPSCSNNATDGAETATDCGGDRCPACSEGKACELARDCVSLRCVNKVCAASVCGDQVKNGLESDVDCGGDCSAKCSINEGCARNSDCSSGKCSAGKCLAPACNDEVQNDLETDVDCGGSICVAQNRKCADGRFCLSDLDCASNVCNAATGKCQAQSCSDARKNQTETDVDCGGPCGGCAADKKCTAPSDCIDKNCVGGTCAKATCSDGIKNGIEGDKDCGGDCSAKCAVDKGCNNDNDCVEGVCGASGICQAPTCFDTVKNGTTETDVDCGGSCAKKCAAGLKCKATTDCDTVAIPGTVCTGGTCVAPGCNDNIKNTFETDVDCGGAQCKPCALSKACQIDGDCDPITSGNCDVVSTALVCVAATCSDSLKNGAETDKDCGGSNLACARCGDGKVCNQGSDCTSQVCDNNLCLAPTCSDGKKNGAETALDCGGATCAAQNAKCALDAACAADRDCVSGWCHPTTKVCTTRTCTDTIKNGTESDVDCGEICSTTKCAVGKKCGTDNDCASGACSECTGLCINPPSSCLNQSAVGCGQCAVGGACSTDFDCASLNCVSGKCATADTCLGGILSDADGYFADGTEMCDTQNETEKPRCKAFLRCLFVNNCNPVNPCFTDNTGICGVNQPWSGGSAAYTPALDTWKKAGCTDPLK